MEARKLIEGGFWTGPQRVVPCPEKKSTVTDVRVCPGIFESELTASSPFKGRGSFIHLEDATCTVWF